MKIYLASPFFNDEELEYVCEAEQVLANKGLDVYSPMRHEDRDEKRTAAWSVKTFMKDVEAINKADAVVMLYHGNYSDSGTAWECGFAYALNKPVIVVHLGGPSNLMVHIRERIVYAYLASTNCCQIKNVVHIAVHTVIGKDNSYV